MAEPLFIPQEASVVDIVNDSPPEEPTIPVAGLLVHPPAPVTVTE
ncbi:MAG: hypothetical protein V4615_01385 [Bacteroidota bacterium]